MTSICAEFIWQMSGLDEFVACKLNKKASVR